MNLREKVAYLGAISFLIGIVLISLGVPISAIIALCPEGKLAFFIDNWVLVSGIAFLLLWGYILFWGASFQKVLKFCKDKMDCPDPDPKEQA